LLYRHRRESECRVLHAFGKNALVKEFLDLKFSSKSVSLRGVIVVVPDVGVYSPSFEDPPSLRKSGVPVDFFLSDLFCS
jgi:hypothetical protein